MNPSFSSLEQAKSTLIDLALRFGPKMLAALLILALGFVVSGWVARWVAKALTHIELEPPVRDLLTRIARVLVMLLFVVRRCRTSVSSCCL